MVIKKYSFVILWLTINVNSFVMESRIFKSSTLFLVFNSSVMLETLWKPPMLIQIENANCQATTPETFSI